jgi:hypothetical protein
MVVDTTYLIYGFIAMVALAIYVSIRNSHNEEIRLLKEAKKSDIDYRSEVEAQIQNTNDGIKVINIPIKGKYIQRECESVVTKMFSNGYRLTAVAPIIDSHREGDAGITKTVSLVHYFERKSV